APPWVNAAQPVAPRLRWCSREAFILHHRPRIVERPAEARHHLVDLGLADDQRRAEGDDVAGHVAQYRPVMLGAAHEIRGDARLRVEALLARLVADDLDRADPSNAPRVADERMISVAADRRLHSRPDAANVTDDVTLLVDLQRLEGDRGRHRMRGVGVAM